jgi:NAD(P)-dependent dehydrogenase (short-subunit alcohol dehydrogenase family)
MANISSSVLSCTSPRQHEASHSSQHHLPRMGRYPMFQASLHRIPQLSKMVKSMSPPGRAAEAEEVADVIVFLCSSSATYINGVALTVDAGMTLSVNTA